MKYSPNNKDWAQKYRPTAFKDLVLPNELEIRLAPFAEACGGMSFMFYGQPGTGKTSTACVINPDGTYYVDCSTDRSIDTVRKLKDACSTMPVFGGRRVVVLDEADSLTPEAQAALKNVIERFSESNDFIAITNDSAGLTKALRSRLKAVCFDHAQESTFQQKIIRRLLRVLRVEGRRNESPAALRALVRQEFPDIRRMLKRLQFETA